MKPQVSIIIPLFNRADLIGDTIQSVIDQTCADWELLIVDDHSTDDSFAIASKFAESDPRIRCWARKSSVKGAPSCRNEGFLESSAEFVIFLDSDDLLAPHCIEGRLAQFDRHPNNDFLVFAMQLFDREIGDSQDVWCFTSDDYLGEFLECPLWQTSCPIWRRDFFQEIGTWKEGLPSWQDWELHVRTLSANPRFKVFDQMVDCFYRRGDTGRISVGSKAKPKHLASRIETYFAVAALMQQQGQLTAKRKTALTRQITKVIVLQKLNEEPIVAEASFQRLIEQKFVPPEQVKILRSYLNFEARDLWRKPLFNKTLRRLLKFYYHCQIPQRIHRSGSHKLRLGFSK